LQSYCIKLQPRLVEQIDALVKEGWCASRNEFLREAAMQRVIELRKSRLDEAAKKFAGNLKARGVTAADVEESWGKLSR
jgi:metal-responsive CopG/Arc/MetJ family transcriptional regulator